MTNSPAAASTPARSGTARRSLPGHGNPVGLDYWIWSGRPGGHWDHPCVIFSAIYLLVRCLLSCLMVLAQGGVSKDAELLACRLTCAVPLDEVRLSCPACRGLSAWSHVHEPAVVPLESHGHRGGRPVAVLGHDQVRFAGPR